MAGSYKHCEAEDGTFSFELIENMGDAYEACEHMFFMIRYLAGEDQAKIDVAKDAFYQWLTR